MRLTAIAIILTLTTAFAHAQDRPNILFLYSDDQRADTIAAWGNEHIDTPNLDRIAERGFSFKRNYCMGSIHGAVCVPSRAMVMTGQSFFKIPMDLEGVETLPQRLRGLGDTTFISGKWHNKAPGILKSFEQGKAVMMGGMSNHLEVPLADIGDGELVNRRTGEALSSEIFADAAIDFLENHDTDSPFFCYVPFTAPHDPRQPPEALREKYYARDLPLPENYMPQHPFDNGRLVTRDENLGPWPRTEEIVRDQLAEYYGLIEHLDTHIGRILDALAASPHADSTYIVFAADHGLAVGSHGLLGKQNIYEHSMRAPMIIAGPGIPHGETQALTYLLDIVPTISDLTGTPRLAPLDGESLQRLWTGEADRLRHAILLAYEDSQRALVTERFKLIQYPKINHTQLFDLQNDPHELNNIATHFDYTGWTMQLTGELAGAQLKYGDTAPLTTENPKPMEIDLTNTPRKPDHWQPEWIVEKYF